MKNVKYISLIITCYLLVSFSMPVSDVSLECKQIVETYLNQLTSREEERGEKAYYAEYTTTTEFSAASGNNTTEANTKVLSSYEGLMLIDENMELYANCEYIFVILPKQKRIYLNDADPQLYQKNNSYDKQLQIQKVLMDSALQVNCDEDESEIDVEVTPGEEFSNSFHLIKQHLIYDQKLDRVVEVINSYDEKSGIQMQKVLYKVIDYNSSLELPDPVSKLFSGNRLKSEFQSYQIIDNRTNHN